MQLRGQVKEIEEAGARLAVVTMGAEDDARRFCSRFGRDAYTCLADPERGTYASFGLLRGTVMDVAGPRVWLAGARALAEGFIASVEGDVYQLGGTFAIRRDGTVAFAHYSRTSSDNAEPADALAALTTEP